jgi:pimeloyl-ACP methyl ester carboxylesterase
MPFILPVLGAALILWGGAATTVAVNQERLLFHGTPLPETMQSPPTIEDRYLDVPGARLHGWLYRRPGGHKGLVMYLHGNSGNVATWLTQTRFWDEAGMDVFVLDYRGFGRSTGEISSEAQLHDDVWRAWQAVSPPYAGQRIVLLGRSIGTGLAARLSTRVKSDLLVLVSPYASMARIASEQYPWVPGLALKYPLHTDEALARSQAQATLIFHGDADALIPIDHARSLNALYPQARLVPIPGAGHNDIQNFKLYQQSLLDALKALPADQVQP